jgi:hypothetical protein
MNQCIAFSRCGPDTLFFGLIFICAAGAWKKILHLGIYRLLGTIHPAQCINATVWYPYGTDSIFALVGHVGRAFSQGFENSRFTGLCQTDDAEFHFEYRNFSSCAVK